MASIHKRKNGTWYVKYYFNGELKWGGTCKSEKEANKLKIKIENEIENRTHVVPANQKFEAFIMEWVEVHAKANWSGSTYDTSMGLINNHIITEIGHLPIGKITPKDIEMMFDRLMSKKANTFAAANLSEEEKPFLSGTTLRYIYIIVKQAFDKAVEWELIAANPVKISAPARNEVERKAWHPEMIKLALMQIQHKQLHLAVHLAFYCSLRIGEVLGLTWDCVDFDNLTIKINKTLQRMSMEALKKTRKNEIIMKFDVKMAERAKSILVLKDPKTKNSKRMIFISPQLANELMEAKAQIEKEKIYLGSDYNDFNLVFSLPDGTPVEPHLCEKWFKKWQTKSELGFPEIVFHELRHSSTTYKLRLSQGDLKSVQSDTGHASAEMVYDIYSHMMDEDRIKLAKNLQKDFYGEAAAVDSSTDSSKQSQRNSNDNERGSTEISSSEMEGKVLAKLLDELKQKDPLLHQKVLHAVLAPQD